MNKRQAQAEGLTFTGHYENYWKKDKLKNIAGVIRKLYKCRVVMVDEGHGISLYADEKYDAIRGVRDEQNVLAREATDLQKAKEEYEQKVAKIKDRADCARKYIEAQENRFPEIKGQTFPHIYDYMSEHGIEFD